jgi:hypothetical protein
MTRPGIALVLSLLCCTLGGCLHPFTVTLNDNVVYTPNEALRNAVTEDAGLQACLDQTLERNEHADLTLVTLLACPSAGVESLKGIEALVNLEQLELSDNALTNLSPLIPLKNLRVVGLRNNKVGDIRRFLSLEGNNGIPCRQLDTFAQKLGNTFGRPESCIN